MMDLWKWIQVLIIDWSTEFKRIFSSLSTTECSFPKLHSWRYHVIPTIRKYGALNGLSTETYETLHKSYVKNPYRSSNRKNAMRQIVNAVSQVSQLWSICDKF